MPENQQQHQNQTNTGDDMPEGKTMKKFKYKRRSPFPLLLRIAEYEINAIEDFFDRAKEAWRAGQQDLEQIAASSGENVPDDWLFDDGEQLKEFAWLYSEFAIIGLWRCVELYEAEAKRHIRRHEQSTIRAALDNIIKDEQKKIHCAESVKELHLLNNAIKHERRVGKDLAKISTWKNKKGDELGDLESHYYRLRPFAKQYLEDLTERLNNAKISGPNSTGQVSKT